MAIKIVTGAPGSGKTYYIMREVIGKNYEYCKDFDEWKPKNKITIFTNIDKLKLPHINLDNYLREKQITIKDFFTVEYARALNEKYGHIVIIIDEAQKYFPFDFKDEKEVTGGKNPEKSVFYFFEYHRHLGVDIYLCAQMWTRLNPNISGLAEYQIEAVRRTFSVVGEFRYKFLNGREVIQNKVIKCDKKIFALYNSFEVDEENSGKQIRPIRKYIIIIVGLFCLLIFLFNLWLKTFFPTASPPGEAQAAASAKAGERPAGAVAAPAPGPVQRIDNRVPGAGAFASADVVQVRAGVMWMDDEPVLVQVMGRTYRGNELPWSARIDKERRTLTVLVPRAVYREHIAQAEIVLQSDATRASGSASRPLEKM